MKTQRLAFTQLHEELVILEKEDLRIIRGGVLPTQWEYAIDPQGNVYWRVAGDETWIAFNTLNEVEIVAHQNSSNWGSYVSTNPFNYGGGGSGEGTGGGGGTGGGTGGNGPTRGALLATGQSGASVLDIIGLMNTAFSLTATQAQLSASAFNLQSLAQFTSVARFFGVVDVVTNIVEFFDSEADAAHRMEDLGQAAMGLTLAFAVSNPVGLVVGGIALAAWEIYEYKRDQSPILN